MTKKEISEYHKKYYQSHKEKIIEYVKKYSNNPKGKKARKKYENSSKGRKTKKKYYEYHREELNRYSKKYNEEVYNKARMVIGKGAIKCINCGCDDKRIVEINHIDGGGCQEFKKNTNGTFYRAIVNGERKTDDLNLLCRLCNTAHFLELKYGEFPYDIKWRGK